MKKKIAIAAVRLMVVAGIFGVVYNAKADCGPGMGNPCVPADPDDNCAFTMQGSPYNCPGQKHMEKVEPIGPITL